MYIYNITFAAEASRLDRLIAWIRSEAVPRMAVAPASSPMLSMVEGVEAEADMVKSVALQLRFESIADLARWQEEAFEPAMEIYAREFAPEPLFFATLLRELPLK